MYWPSWYYKSIQVYNFLMRNLKIEQSPRKNKEMVKYNRGYSENFTRIWTFLFCFYLAEGRTLHLPPKCSWHSGLFLNLLNRFFQRNYISGLLFLWKKCRIICSTTKEQFWCNPFWRYCCSDDQVAWTPWVSSTHQKSDISSSSTIQYSCCHFSWASKHFFMYIS